MDVIYLDFAKAFDKVSHKRLLRKLSGYGSWRPHGVLTATMALLQSRMAFYRVPTEFSLAILCALRTLSR